MEVDTSLNIEYTYMEYTYKTDLIYFPPNFPAWDHPWPLVSLWSGDVIWLINEPSGVLTPTWSLCDICGCHPGMGFTRPVKNNSLKISTFADWILLDTLSWNIISFEFHKNHRARNWIKYHIRVWNTVTPRLLPNLQVHKNLTRLSLSVWHLMCEQRGRGSVTCRHFCEDQIF